MNWKMMILAYFVVSIVSAVLLSKPACPRICGVEHTHITHKVGKCPQELCQHLIRR